MTARFALLARVTGVTGGGAASVVVACSVEVLVEGVVVLEDSLVLDTVGVLGDVLVEETGSLVDVLVDVPDTADWVGMPPVPEDAHPETKTTTAIPAMIRRINICTRRTGRSANARGGTAGGSFRRDRT